MKTRLCLIRHGETEWNAGRRIQGQIDIALNALGRQQARAAGRSLQGCGLTALYASDLRRAWETAELIGAALHLQPQPEPSLRERDYGIFSGLTYAEAEERHPEAYAGEAVALVLHGGVLDVINRFVRATGLDQPRDFLIPNAGLNWLSVSGGVWQIDSWGETAHLAPGALDELPA